MMDITIFTDGGGQGAGRGHYPFIKMRKSQEQYPYQNQISNNFYLNFLFDDGYLKFSLLEGAES